MSFPAASSTGRTDGSAAGRSVWVGAGLAFVAALVASAVATTVVVLVARALGVPPLPMFTPRAYLMLTAVGVLLGTLGWLVVRRVARDPRRVLTVLVPLVLLVSLVPDVLVGLAGVPVSGVVALMVMHLAVGAVAVPLFARFLPLPARRGAEPAR